MAKLALDKRLINVGLVSSRNHMLWLLNIRAAANPLLMISLPTRK